MKHKKEEIYLDLSKCRNGEQQKKAISLLPKQKQSNQYQITYAHTILSLDENNEWWVFGATALNKKEITYPEFIKLFEGGESKEVLQVENNEWIKSIAISHQKQMSSTHPHAIIGIIEDAIIEALETFKSNN